MKKGLIIGLAASLAITLGATWVLAESPSHGMMNIGNMNAMHKQMAEQCVKDGVLTPEQAKTMDDHMANMSSAMAGNASCQSNQQSTAIPQQ